MAVEAVAGLVLEAGSTTSFEFQYADEMHVKDPDYAVNMPTDMDKHSALKERISWGPTHLSLRTRHGSTSNCGSCTHQSVLPQSRSRQIP